MLTLKGLKSTSYSSFGRIKQNSVHINTPKGLHSKVKYSKKVQKPLLPNFKFAEAFISEEEVNKITSKTQHKSISTFLKRCLGFSKNKIEDIKSSESLPQMIAQNIEKAKISSTQKDLLIFDEILPYPAQFSFIVSDKTSAGYRFFNSLRGNKSSLIKDLGIDAQTYDSCAQLAMKIAHNESQLGESKKFKFYDTLESNDFILDLGSSIRKFFRGDGDLSLGLTQFKIAKAKNTEKELFKKYGIIYENTKSNILEPEKSAIATVIHLAELSKDYPKYLEEVKKIRPNTYRVTIRKAINNAKQILFNDSKRPDALKALTGKLYAKTGMSAGTKIADFTAKDLNDLRVYASTVELSPQAYLAARWNGRKIIPSGKGSDIACKNLLNIIAQKGYVANVDKSSKIIY